MTEKDSFFKKISIFATKKPLVAFFCYPKAYLLWRLKETAETLERE
ncbi:MAG: hypothetical protein J6M41_09990 [Prevotella sp.]|nr:hypothetical protein [Prevotella sp.]MBR6320644.1 hypothetical protein [Prevotella sp.]